MCGEVKNSKNVNQAGRDNITVLKRKSKLLPTPPLAVLVSGILVLIMLYVAVVVTMFAPGLDEHYRNMVDLQRSIDQTIKTAVAEQDKMWLQYFNNYGPCKE
jgi:hypothetical protein